MMRALLAFLLIASATQGADPKIHRDIAYAEPKNERQSLDVFSPADGQNHPIIFWIHGGGWKRGDKSNVQRKPQAFTDKGYVFVSANYRFVPNVNVKAMASDIAKSIHWVYDHAKEFGGDPNSIFVMGHSAGAHLAALVCTDDRYLRNEGLSLAYIKGCVPVDTAAYDISKRLSENGPEGLAAAKEVFGETQESHQDLSPVTFVAKGKNIPPFLLLHVATRAESKSQTLWFADKLSAAGVSAKVVAGQGKDHGTINADLGLADDEPTKAVYEFMDRALQQTK